MDWYRRRNLLDLFGLDENASLKTLTRRYKQAHAKYLSDKMSEEMFILLERAYLELKEYFDELEKEKFEYKSMRKRILLNETKRMNEELKRVQEYYNYKGKVWVFFEKFRDEDINLSFDDYIEYIKINVLDGLDEEYKELYNEFLSLFLKLWNIFYEHILKCEQNLLKRERFDESIAFSVGEDELTDAYYLKNRYFHAYGKFSRLLQLSNILSSLVPEEESNYFLEVHLSLMSKFFMLGYGVSRYDKTPIYSFIVNTRLKEFKNKYYEMFDDEVRNGIRKSPIVDNNELLSYVKDSVDKFNKEKKYELAKKS